MSWKIVTLPKAHKDLLGIMDYLSGFYPSTPRNFAQAYRKTMATVKNNPYSWSEYYDYPLYRRAIAGKYTVLYIVDDEAHEVQVHRILRGSSDILRILQGRK